MKKELKKAWIKALRSGEYKQGTNFLCAEGKYCCLGVLADISLDTYWTISKSASFFAGREVWRIRYSTEFFSDKILKKLELSSHDQGILTELNDSRRWSFKKIANWIEKNIDAD